MFAFLRRAKKPTRDEAAVEAAVGQMLAAPIENSGGGGRAVYPLSDPGLYTELFGVAPQGVTPDVAMTQGVVYSCVFLVAASIGMLDLKSYETNADGELVEETRSPQADVLGVRPAPRYSRTMLWRQIVSDMLLNGNGIVWIERKRSGDPISLHPIPWRRVGIYFKRLPPTDELEITYGLVLDDGRFVQAHSDDVLHIPGSATWDIFRAVSPLTAYALSVGIGLSADKYAKAYFDNGFSADGVVTYPQGSKAGKDQADEIREYIKRKFSGSNRFAGPLVLDNGGTFTQMQINAADAQLIQSRRYNSTDIARIFRVPPHLINEFDKAANFGKGLEEMTQQFIDYTLGPHLRAIEDEINFKLYPSHSKRRAIFDRDGFVRGDLKSKAEAMQILMGGAQGPGIINRNEARVKLGMPRIKGGDHDQFVEWGAADQPKQGAAPEAEPAPDVPKTPKPRGPNRRADNGDLAS